MKVDRTRSAALHSHPAGHPTAAGSLTSNRFNHAIAPSFIYSLEEAKINQVTDGLSDVSYRDLRSATASTFTSPPDRYRAGRLRLRYVELSASADAQRLCLVLRKDLPSPLAPESDEEKVAAEKPTENPAEKKPEAGAKEPVKVTIDFDRISQRILALPIPARNFVALVAGKAGQHLHRRIRRPRAAGADSSASTISRSANSIKFSKASADSISLPTARSFSTARVRTGLSPPPRNRSNRATGSSRPKIWKSISIRRPSGRRCIAKRGASNATSSTRRTITVSI